MEKKHLNNRTFQILKENEKIKENYKFCVQGLEFIGFPNVISPVISPSTSIWKELPIHTNDRFLEIGCGTGVFSILAAKKGASKVTAVDINPDAIANTIVNANLHDVTDRLEAYQSDIFMNIPLGAKYDLILWNIPWSNIEKENLSILEQATFDPGYVLLDRYLAESHQYLSVNGRLLVGYSSTYGNMELFFRLASKYLWNVKLLYRVGSEETFYAELFELTYR